MKHKRLRKKLKEVGFKDETIDKIINLYTELRGKKIRLN
jgi:hypothetical protein